MRRYGAPARIALLTLTAFLPTLWNGFVDWDDSANLLENPHYRGLGGKNLSWMFTTFLLGHYQPLSWMSLGLDYLIWGMNPFGCHLTSLILHAVNGVLFYFVALQLFNRASRGLALAAEFAALVFAVHPLRVESVAWATERRDVLSGLFFLAAILLYLRACDPNHEKKRRIWLTLSLFVFALSLLSKAMGMTLPLVLLLLDVYPLRRRITRSVLLEKIPFFVLSAAAGVLALMGQVEARAAASWESYGLSKRLAQSVYALIFYLGKTVFPFDLAALYEVPPNFDPMDWIYLACGAAAVAITVTLILTKPWFPAGLAAWSSYVILVSPVLGIVATGPQIAADRYTYLACLPWAVLAGAGVAWIRQQNLRRSLRVAALMAPITIVGALPVLTWRQTKIWRDDETFWSYTVSVRPQAWIAHGNYANTRYRQGDLKGAAQYYKRSLQLRPKNEKTLYYTSGGREDRTARAQALRATYSLMSGRPLSHVSS